MTKKRWLVAGIAGLVLIVALIVLHFAMHGGHEANDHDAHETMEHGDMKD